MKPLLFALLLALAGGAAWRLLGGPVELVAGESGDAVSRAGAEARGQPPASPAGPTGSQRRSIEPSAHLPDPQPGLDPEPRRATAPGSSPPVAALVNSFLGPEPDLPGLVAWVEALTGGLRLEAGQVERTGGESHGPFWVESPAFSGRGRFRWDGPHLEWELLLAPSASPADPEEPWVRPRLGGRTSLEGDRLGVLELRLETDPQPASSRFRAAAEAVGGVGIAGWTLTCEGGRWEGAPLGLRLDAEGRWLTLEEPTRDLGAVANGDPTPLDAWTRAFEIFRPR